MLSYSDTDISKYLFLYRSSHYSAHLWNLNVCKSEVHMSIENFQHCGWVVKGVMQFTVQEGTLFRLEYRGDRSCRRIYNIPEYPIDSYYDIDLYEDLQTVCGIEEANSLIKESLMPCPRIDCDNYKNHVPDYDVMKTMRLPRETRMAFFYSKS